MYPKLTPNQEDRDQQDQDRIKQLAQIIRYNSYRDSPSSSSYRPTTEEHLMEVARVINLVQQQNPNQYVDDTIIAQISGLPIQSVRDYLDLLEEQGKIKSANTSGGYSASL